MRDPYLQDECNTLKNKLGITSQDLLNDAEADYVSLRLRELAQKPLQGNYHTPHLLSMHRYLFQDIFEWAGEPRKIAIYKEEAVLGGMSVEYSDPFDVMSDLHFCLSDMRNKPWESMDINEKSVEFSKALASLWRIHPFREGNTRTTVTFCCQFADEIGFRINRKLFEDNSVYVRTSLVAYNAYFADGNNFAKQEYLEKIVKDALSS